jgi:hypothetical protein
MPAFQIGAIGRFFMQAAYFRTSTYLAENRATVDRFALDSNDMIAK